MIYQYRTFIAGLALLACNGAVRADQFGLLVPAANGGQFAGNPGEGVNAPPPVLSAPPPMPQYDWMGRQISFESAAMGPEVQIGSESLVCEDCCLPPWAHRCGVFAELLYLRARDAEVAYAVPVDGAIVPPPGVAPIQVGPIGVADPDYTAGYRIGATWAMDECTSIVFSYSRFQSSTNDSITTDAPNVIRSLVLHPGTVNAGSDFLDARATSDIDFDLVDVDYRAVWGAGDLYAVNYILGLRYARLNQDFTGVFTSTGTTDTLLTNSNFEGAGLKIGIDGERHACNSGLFVYGRTTASFVAGDSRARYRQSSDVDPLIVNTTWKAGRVVTILDLELGAGWQSCCGRWRVNGGYIFNSWYNVLPTDQWIQNVQGNNFVDNDHHNDAITFDGFTFRVTYQW